MSDDLARILLAARMADPQRRNQMQQAGQDALSVSDAVPHPGRGFQWAPSARQSLPELPTTYRPPERYNYGKPVRLA